MPVVLRQVLFGLGVVLLQWLVFGRLRLWGAYPDVVLLFVAWIGLRYGRVQGTVTGFLTGFLLDVIYGTWGIHMFVKTVVGFLVGMFVVVLALANGTRAPALITALWIGSAIYTALVAVVWSLIRSS